MAGFNAVVQDTAGNALTNVNVTVQDAATLALVPVFSNAAMSVALGNPFNWADGSHLIFYVAAGIYKITVTKGGFTQIWNDQQIGDLGGGPGGGAPTDAEYVVAALHGSLSAERVLTNTASVTWDFSTPGQAKATAVVGAGGAPDGSVGAPGIAFAADTDTGFFRPGANQIGVAVGAIEAARFINDAGVGRLIMGHTAALSLGGVNAQLQIHSLSTSALSIARWDNSASAGFFMTGAKSRGGAIGVHAALQSGDVLGNWQSAGSDGAAFGTAVRVRALADATFAAGSTPGRFDVGTTPSGSTTPVTRFQVFQDGGVRIGPTTTSPGAGVVAIEATTATSSAATGALVVAGAVGIGGNVNIGGNNIAIGSVAASSQLGILYAGTIASPFGGGALDSVGFQLSPTFTSPGGVLSAGIYGIAALVAFAAGASTFPSVTIARFEDIFSTNGNTVQNAFSLILDDQTKGTIKNRSLQAAGICEINAPIFFGHTAKTITQAAIAATTFGSSDALAFYDASGLQVGALSDTAANNIWSNTTHEFRNRSQSATFAQISSAGLLLRASASAATTISAPATAGSHTIKLPGGATDLSLTGGQNHVLSQQSVGGPITSFAAREALTASRQYFVRTDGSDTLNNGLADNAGGAFRTVQKAIDTAAALDCKIFDVTITVRAGTYQPSDGFTQTGVPVANLKQMLGSGNFLLEGDITTPSNVTFNAVSPRIDGLDAATIYGEGAACRWRVRGIKILATTTGHGLEANKRASLIVAGNMEFGALPAFYSHILSQIGASVSVLASVNYTISGNAAAHLNANYQGYIDNLFPGGTITITGTPTFTSFALAANGGVIVATNQTFSGAVNAATKRHDAASLAMITIGSATYFPGGVAGTPGLTAPAADGRAY